MNTRRLLHLIAALTISIAGVWLLALSTIPHLHIPPAALAAMPPPPLPQVPSTVLADSPISPTNPVKLIFIHHSSGENWLADDDGGLGIELMNNNYFVSDTNYEWGPDDADLGYEKIGDHTDSGHWYNWFVGPNHITYTNALYTEYTTHSYYTRLTDPDPGRENEIIMFKSCYPNSHISGVPTDPPTSGDNPLRGQDAGSEHMTVANVKGIYNDILGCFATQTDSLFVLIVSPPQIEDDTDATHAANARAVADWLVNDWLDDYGYPHNNVAVFDFYNVLTSNGGDVDTNDLNSETGNHHRWWSGTVQHTQTVINDFSYYGGGNGGGSHPTAAGNEKATEEFVPLLNVYYNRWKSGGTTCEPISDVSITGPTVGYTGTLYAFTAAVIPSNATPPITYTWSPAPDVGSSAVVSYTWATTGTKAITVTAENCGGSDTDPHTITIKAKGQYNIYLPLVLRDYASSSGGSLVQPGDLTYLGAFRLPDRATGAPDEESWEYSGQALTYRPDGDPGGGGDGHPGSLFGTGHDVWNYVSEIGIPAPGTSRDLEMLNVATTTQGFYDVRGGLFDGLVEMPRVGMQYLPAQAGQTSAKLHLAWGAHNQDEGTPSDTPSHAWCDLDLSTPDTQGAWWIGDVSLYRVNGYMFEIPQEWADEYVGGARLATGRYRDGGWSGMGPNIFAYGPWLDGSPPAPGTLLTTHTLLSYSYAGGEHTIDNYQDADEWEGGAWVTAGGKTAVVFVGTKGGGYWWYGYFSPAGDGMPCPYVPEPGEGGEVRCYNSDGTDCAEGLLDCGGHTYTVESKGWWSSRFDAQMIFYDPADFVAVLNGTLEPDEPQPYATLDIDGHLFLDPPVGTEVDCGTGDQRKCRIGEMAYDRERGFLYVLERFADDAKPVVHVWGVQ